MPGEGSPCAKIRAMGPRKVLRVGFAGVLVIVGAGLAEGWLGSGPEPAPSMPAPAERIPDVRPGDPAERAGELLRIAGDQRQQGKPDEALKTLEKARAIGRAHPDGAEDQGLRAAELAAEILMDMGRNRRAVHLLEEAVSGRRRRGERALAARDLNRMATALFLLGNYEQCVERALEALHMATAEGLPAVEARSQFLIGYVNRQLEHYPKALERFQTAETAAREAGDTTTLVQAINEEANVLQFLGRTEEAIERKRQAMEIARASENPFALASCEHDMAVLLSSLGRHREALLIFERAYKTFHELDSARGQSVAASNVSEQLLKLGRPKEAALWARRALEAAQRSELPEERVAAGELLAKTLAKLGRHREAFQTLQEAHTLSGEILRNESSRAIQDLERRFEAERRQAELEHAQKVHELEFKRERIRRRLWTGAFLAMALVLLLLARLYRLKVRTSRQVTRAKEQLEEAHERLAELARTDGLTGLANRREAERWLALEAQRSLRSGNQFTVLMLDIDHFKRINDTHGHHAGDMVLRDLAAVLRQSIRSLDLAARWGGEEFLVGLSETDLQGARTVAENIRSSLARNPCGAGEDPIPVTVTIGISPCSGRDPAACLRRADEALYAGKRSGRDRVVTEEELGGVPSGE